MFTCSKCASLEDQVKFLRQQNKDLMDRLVALANSQAYQAISYERADASDFYGSGDDQYVGYDNYGNKILLEKDTKEPAE